MRPLVLATLSLSVAVAAGGADVIYDSLGFEDFNEGYIEGQDGWHGFSFEGGADPWVWKGAPAQGTKCVALRVDGFPGAGVTLYRHFADLLGEGYSRVTVSFDVYREVQFNGWINSMWWSWDNTGGWPNGGGQFDAGLPGSSRTYVVTDGGWPGDQDEWTDTVLDEWTRVEMTWDFEAGWVQGAYNGVPVDGKPLHGFDALSEWYFMQQHVGPQTGSPEDLWIDNFVVSAERDRDCYSDCDYNGELNLFDFLCFTNEFNAQTDYADCNSDGAWDLFDFLCYISVFGSC